MDNIPIFNDEKLAAILTKGKYCALRFKVGYIISLYSYMNNYYELWFNKITNTFDKISEPDNPDIEFLDTPGIKMYCNKNNSR